MRSRKDANYKTLLLVGVWVNRKWILGNWIREVNLRYPKSTRLHWTASVFAAKHFWEKLVKFPLPKHCAYFFSYPSIFESYLKSKPKEYRYRSIVNYTHNMDELGDLSHQVSILNQAYSVHFNCSSNAEALVGAGLDPEKVRLVLGAVDADCKLQVGIQREAKTVLLASRFSERKGVGILPEVVELLPEWKFIILGRGWENFLNEEGLRSRPNIEYHFFNKETRNIAMSRAQVFLSLSKLEGGPIPLIESMAMGVIPVATDTGFARDVILHGKNGLVIPNPPSPDQVRDAVNEAVNLAGSPQDSVKHLTWDRLSKIVMKDAYSISSIDDSERESA